MSRTATTKTKSVRVPLVYVGVRVPGSLWKAMDEYVRKVNQEEPWRNYLLANLIREALSLGLDALKNKRQQP